MAHNLSINEQGEAEMFSGQGITPWHKLGTVVPGLLTAKEAIETANLDWDVVLAPIFTKRGSKILTVQDFQAVIRKDSGRALSVVGNRYHPIQNSEAFEFFDEVVGEGQAIYDTAGSLNGGKRVWIMAKLKGELFLDSRPNDKMDKNVLLVTSHDGTSGLSMQIVGTRVVCQNTLSVALGGAVNRINIRHTSNYKLKKDEAMKALKLCNAYFSDLQAVINSLDAVEMTQDGMNQFVEKLLPMPENNDESTRTSNMREEIASLFSKGKGNLGKSRFDALNACTEYVDHHRSTRTSAKGNPEEKRFISSMFGSGANLKDRAFQLLTA